MNGRELIECLEVRFALALEAVCEQLGTTVEEAEDELNEVAVEILTAIHRIDAARGDKRVLAEAAVGERGIVFLPYPKPRL